MTVEVPSAVGAWALIPTPVAVTVDVPAAVGAWASMEMAVAAAVGGMYFWWRGRPLDAAFLFAVGAAFKLFPLFFIGPLLFDELFAGRVKRGLTAAAMGAGTFVAINLPGGSNNDQDIWYGTPTATAAQTQEAADRTGADLRWLDLAFAQAQAAVVLAEVEWDVLEPLLDPVEAARRGSLVDDSTYSRGDVEAGFAQADAVVEAEYRTQTLNHNSLETHQAVCEWRGDGIDVYISTQAVWGVRDGVASAFDLPADKVRVDNPTQNLESYFLDVVEKAKLAAAQTSGATSGARVAAYLRGEAEAKPISLDTDGFRVRSGEGDPEWVAVAVDREDRSVTFDAELPGSGEVGVRLTCEKS